MPLTRGWWRWVEWLPEGPWDGNAEQFEGAGLDGGGAGEFLHFLPGEDDGLPVEGGQELAQDPVPAGGQAAVGVLGGGLGPALRYPLGAGPLASWARPSRSLPSP